jgi:hypothetical protein
MKADTNGKQVAAAWATAKEIERLVAAITARSNAPRELWQRRHREHAALVAELAAEKFDPEAPLAPEGLKAHSERVTKVQVYEGLFRNEPRKFQTLYAADGGALLAELNKLADHVWEVAEPVELRREVLLHHGICGLGSTGIGGSSLYSCEIGKARLLSWAKNFTLDAAQALLSLAKDILSRKLSPLPVNFGATLRPLTWAEQRAIDNAATLVRPAA